MAEMQAAHGEIDEDMVKPIPIRNYVPGADQNFIIVTTQDMAPYETEIKYLSKLLTQIQFLWPPAGYQNPLAFSGSALPEGEDLEGLWDNMFANVHVQQTK